MKVLFFTYDFPCPTNSGGKVRAYNLLKHAGKGVEITLFSFVRSDFDKKNIEKLRDIGVERVEIFPRKKVRDITNAKALFTPASIFATLYKDSRVIRRLKEIIDQENISLIHFESFYTAFYLDDYFTTKNIKQVYGSENIENKIYADYVKHKIPFLIKPFFIPQVQRIKREEIVMSRKADATVAVTASEKDYFENISGKKAYIIENGINLSEFSYIKRARKENVAILFVGNFSYFPNMDAIRFFISQVLRKIPDERITFVIIGKGAKQFASLDKRIKTVEYVDDIRDAYYEADIFVSPIRLGGGTNFKVLEAMATGVPVVAFTERVTDLGVVNGRDILSADNADTFREHVLRLIREPELREKLAKNARKIIEEKYSWEKIGKNLNALWKELDEKN